LLQIPEAPVESDHQPPIFGRCPAHCRVIATEQTFVLDRVDIVSHPGEDRRGARRKVLVELDLPAAATAAYSSLARSAPWAAAARTPSTSSDGYSATISASVIPDARQSKMMLTMTRVPRTTAWP